jgi:excisionase family DNA binding protein
MEKKLLKVEEAAEVLSISVRRMYQLIEKDQIRSVKLGRVRRVPVAAVNEFVEQLDALSGSADEILPRASTPTENRSAKPVSTAGDGPSAA